MRNAPSPGATSSMAIAEEIVTRAWADFITSTIAGCDGRMLQCVFRLVGCAATAQPDSTSHRPCVDPSTNSRNRSSVAIAVLRRLPSGSEDLDMLERATH